MPWRFPRSRILFPRPNDFGIGFHLLIEGGQRRSDKPFNEHSDQDTFGRPIGISTVDPVGMLYQSFLLVSLIFFITRSSIGNAKAAHKVIIIALA